MTAAAKLRDGAETKFEGNLLYHLSNDPHKFATLKDHLEFHTDRSGKKEPQFSVTKAEIEFAETLAKRIDELANEHLPNDGYKSFTIKLEKLGRCLINEGKISLVIESAHAERSAFFAGRISGAAQAQRKLVGTGQPQGNYMVTEYTSETGEFPRWYNGPKPGQYEVIVDDLAALAQTINSLTPDKDKKIDIPPAILSGKGV